MGLGEKDEEREKSHPQKGVLPHFFLVPIAPDRLTSGPKLNRRNNSHCPCSWH